ncbi:type II toxin-antitoxin system MqsR family toxin [Oxalobacteraceae bacterium A2-2]
MEKHTPHCKLSKVKALVTAGRVLATNTAMRDARGVGITTLQGMCEILLSLTPADFYKSMTSHLDHRIWQDVYHGMTADGIALYIKVTVINDVLIVSFKEL